MASVSFLFLAVGDVLPYGEVSSTEEVLSEASSSTDVVAFASARLLRHGSNGRKTGGLRGLGLGSGFSSDDTNGDAVTSKV